MHRSSPRTRTSGVGRPAALALLAATLVGGLLAPSIAFAQAANGGRSIARMSKFEPSASLGVTEGEIKLPPIGLGGGVDTLDKDGTGSETLFVLSMKTAFKFWRLKAGLQLDLRFDEDLEIRERDFDERSDYLRFIDYVEFGEPGQFAHLRVGRLRDFSVGHGTIVGHYYSDTDYDSPLTGFAAGFHADWIGVEAMTNDITRFNFNAARIYVEPFNWSENTFLEHITIGGSVAVDFRAPGKLRTLAGIPQLDDEVNFRTSNERVLIYGADLELPILETPIWDFTPYVDYNWIQDHGSGGHFGAIFGLTLPFAFEADLTARLEYRAFQSEYIGTYFDAFYEIERFRYPDLASATTKEQFLDEQGSAQGYMAELRFTIPEMFEIAGSWEDMDGQRNDRLDLFAQFTAFEWLKIRAHYHKRNVGGYEDIASFDDQTFLSAQVLVRIWSGLWADVGFDRTWIMDDGDRRFVPVDAWSLGAMWVISF